MRSVFLSKNRDRLSIVAAILEAANSGSNKTRIKSQANLSSMLTEKYLNLSVNSGFLQIKDSTYVLTENGREFLRNYRRLIQRFSQVEDMLDYMARERKQLSRLIEKAPKTFQGDKYGEMS